MQMGALTAALGGLDKKPSSEVVLQMQAMLLTCLSKDANSIIVVSAGIPMIAGN
jgi:hypothetical protein